MLRFKFTKKVIIEMVFALLTVSSLSVTTFAWFSMQNRVTVTFWTMHVAEQLKVQLKYCVHNKSTLYDSNGIPYIQYTGYNDPRPPTTTDSSQYKTITSYADQFVSIPGNTFEEGGPLDIKNLEPGTCHTFAFEITVPGSSSQDIELRLSGFFSPGSEKNRIYDQYNHIATTTPVVLATAIDFYVPDQVTIKDENDDSANTTAANTFLTSYMIYGPTDRFPYGEATETPRPNGYQLWHQSVSGGATAIVFFTLEFPDQWTSYYLYTQTDGTYDYYTRQTSESQSGDSNVYRGLSFNITDLYVGSVE